MAEEVASLTQLPVHMWEKACSLLSLGDMTRFIDSHPTIAGACKYVLQNYEATFHLTVQNRVSALSPFATTVLQRLGPYLGRVQFKDVSLQIANDCFKCITRDLTAASSALKSLRLVVSDGSDFFRFDRTQSTATWLQILEICVANKKHADVRIHANMPLTGLASLVCQLQPDDPRCQLLTKLKILQKRLPAATVWNIQQVNHSVFASFIAKFPNLRRLCTTLPLISSELLQRIAKAVPSLKMLEIIVFEQDVYDGASDIPTVVWRNVFAALPGLRIILDLAVRSFHDDVFAHLNRVFKSNFPVISVTVLALQCEDTQLSQIVGWCEAFSCPPEMAFIVLVLDKDHDSSSALKSVEKWKRKQRHVDHAVLPSAKDKSMHYAVYRITSCQPRTVPSINRTELRSKLNKFAGCLEK